MLLVVILAVGEYRDALFGIVLVAQRRHRHRPGAPGQAHPRRARRAQRAHGHGAPRRRRASRSPSSELVARRRASCSPPATRSPSTAWCSTRPGLEVDESLLTGEADPVVKDAGDEVLSGSFVVGRQRAHPGHRGRHRRLRLSSWRARPSRFSLVKRELRDGIDTILKLVSWLMIPTAVLLVTAPAPATDEGVVEAVQGSVAGLVAMVPEGLVLLTSIAFAVGVIRLGPQEGAHPGAGRHRGPGPRRRGLPRQDRHPHRGLARARHGRAPRRPRRRRGRRRRGARRARRVRRPTPTRAWPPSAPSFAPPDGWPLDRRGAVLLGPQVERGRLRRPRARGTSARPTSCSTSADAGRRRRLPASASERHAEQGQRVILLAGVARRARRRGRCPPASRPPPSWCSTSRSASDAPDTIAYFRRAGRDGQGHLGRQPRHRRRRRPPGRACPAPTTRSTPAPCPRTQDGAGRPARGPLGVRAGDPAAEAGDGARPAVAGPRRSP